MTLSDWLTPSETPVWSPKRRSRDEFELQRAVKQFLTVALPRDAVFMSIPNDGYRSRKAGGELIATGMLKGAPDLLVVWRGRALFIELKTPTGSLSRAQRIVHKRLLAAEADVCLCRSVPEVEQQLRSIGVPLRASCQA